MSMDLEFFKEVFKDRRTHISVAKIKKLSLAQDRSFLKCLVSIFPEQREVIARMAFSMTGPESGIVEFPEVDDLVLVAFADGDNDLAFVINRLTSVEDKIPLNSVNGDMVFKSKPTKKAWLTSFLRINLSKGDTQPTENLVLGQRLKTLLISLLDKNKELSLKVEELSTKVSIHTHAGNLGYPTSAPNTAAEFVTIAAALNGYSVDYNNLNNSPVKDEVILSNLAFTEKGT